MFYFDLNLVATDLKGVNALDFCRKHGLGDSSEITVGPEGIHGVKFYVRVKCDEGFACAWFDPNEEISNVSVPVEILSKGDLCNPSGERLTYAGFAEISTERAKEIYVAVRFRACRAQVSRLKKQIEELKNLQTK